jgi:hypothetical protein
VEAMFKNSISNICTLLLIFALAGCKEGANNQTQQSVTTGSDAAQISELENKAEEKEFSPDRRLEAFIQATSANQNEENNYRVTIADTEQRKVIFSREFEYADKKVSLGIEKVLDDLVLISEKTQPTAISPDKPQPDVLSKFYVINPASAEFEELACIDFAEGYQISDFNQKTYKCNGKKAGSDQQISEEVNLPQFKELEKTNSQAEAKQVKEADNLKVELTPFDESKGSTSYGTRAALKIFEDDKLIYQKNFSGKCSGCQWVNQDNYQEALKIEQVGPDRVLLTQLIIDQEDKSAGTLYNSLLIVPSKKKLIPLDCNEGPKELAYVSQVNEKTYQCKYITQSGSPAVANSKTVPLPKV